MAPMPVWLLLLSLPIALLIPTGLLVLSAMVEKRVLSSRSLVVTAGRKGGDAEVAEDLVAREQERFENER